MKSSQKKDILEMIGTLRQAHDEIKKNVEIKRYDSAQDLLSQCQECAISIGTAIEKLEGEGFVTVSYIEAYCEALYGIYEEINVGTDISENKIYKVLKKNLQKIENSVRNDISARKEVVFFPYKASMWDSLESVWRAADEDPDCDAYVVPIPYYDKNPDGSFRHMHYEGTQFPKEVPITFYGSYDLETRRPDMIFIHNPYDEYNFVTSVHPSYYSAKLKNYTNQLIYIPYFVMGEISPDNELVIEGKQHYCTTPGVLNADKVIVESEDVRKLYINALTKWAGANSRSQWEKKIFGLGSPKFDKAVNTKKEDLDIPDEWLKIIQKPDGSWKKIVFYNITVSTFLTNNENTLEKMRNVFRIFKENQDEVALLWRPHPLIPATISSMRPHLWNEYEKIRKQYCAEGWGIFDDSADMDRAVVLSDAYYGDRSSVVYLYQKTGKPILLQNVHLLEQ